MLPNAIARLPKWAKIVLGIFSALIVLIIIAGIFGQSDSDDQPAAVDETASPENTPTSTSDTPVPTPTSRVGNCPPERDRAGVEFSYYPAEQSLADAQESNCGTLAPISSVCPDSYDHAGDEYTFDPDVITSEEAFTVNCGTLSPLAGVCPAQYDNADLEYTFDPDDKDESEAVDEYCGTLAPMTAVCSAQYLNRGDPYTYDPDDMSASQARSQNCVERTLSNTDRASIWVFIWDGDYGWMEASAQTSRDVPIFELDVTVAAGIRTDTFCNAEQMFQNQPQELSCATPEFSITQVTDVRACIDCPWNPTHFRCEKNDASRANVHVYACELR